MMGKYIAVPGFDDADISAHKQRIGRFDKKQNSMNTVERADQALNDLHIVATNLIILYGKATDQHSAEVINMDLQKIYNAKRVIVEMQRCFN